MEFLSHNLKNDAQWKTYKQLELVPDSVSKPNAKTISSTLGVGWLWRGLLALLMNELIDEQKVEYLERCWELNEFGQKDKSRANTIQRLWVLMD